VQEPFLGKRRDQAIVQRHHAGRTGLAIKRRQLTEVTASIQILQCDFLALQRIVDDPDPAFDNKENIRRITLAVDDLLVIDIPAPCACLFKGPKRLSAQPFQHTNSIQ
jgi:hypothetical protein